jgi:hypothetical protein
MVDKIIVAKDAVRAVIADYGDAGFVDAGDSGDNFL